MDFLKTVGGKIAGGLVAVAVIAAGISLWRMDAGTRHQLFTGAGRLLAWTGVVLAVPWASFFLIGRVARFESNGAGAALVVGYTALEATLLAWLFNWSIRGATTWTLFAAAVLVAGVYNLFLCDWIAEKVS